MTDIPELEARTATTTAAAPRDAAATLYDLHRQRIREYCVGQLRDRQEADDAVQSTFLYAFMLLQRGVSPTKPLPWLYTIAHNVCRTRRRATKRRGRLESGVDLDTLHDSVGRNDPPREELANLRSSLDALPATQRDALLLREWQGLPYSEIAAHLGLTESAVEALLFRARRSLAQKLQRPAERVASFTGWVLLLRSARRFAPFASTTKATVAAVAIGAAAVTTLVPADQPVSKTLRAARPSAAATVVRRLPADLPTRARAPLPIRNAARARRTETAVQASSTSSATASPDEGGGATASVVVVTPAAPAAETKPAQPPSAGPSTTETVAADVQTIASDVQDAATSVVDAVDQTISSLPAVPDLAGALGPTANTAVSAVETVVPSVVHLTPPPSVPLQGKP